MVDFADDKEAKPARAAAARAVGGEGALKLLVVSSLYPSPAQPAHGIFVRNRLEAFCAQYPVAPLVVAPRPVVVGKSLCAPWVRAAGMHGQHVLESWQSGAQAHSRFYSAEEHLPSGQAWPVLRPGFWYVPKLSGPLNAACMAASIAGAYKDYSTPNGEGASHTFVPDIIDGHYLYPDGVAAYKFARKMGKPLVLTARGSDVTWFAKHPFYRRQIMAAVSYATATVCVSAFLRDQLASLGVPEHKLLVLRNGVDTTRFTPSGRAGVRDLMGVGGSVPVLLFVGGLVERKRVDVAVRAFAQVFDAYPDAQFWIVGQGDAERALKGLVEDLSLTQAGHAFAEAVRFLGPKPPSDVPGYMAAADTLILASESEGWANVILEAAACGTPVVASPAGASGEIITHKTHGRVVGSSEPEAYAKAIIKQFSRLGFEKSGGHGLLKSEQAERGNLRAEAAVHVRARAQDFSWAETSKGLWQLFSRIKAEGR